MKSPVYPIFLTTALLFSTAHAADKVVYSGAEGEVINTQLTLAGKSYSADWYLPSTTAVGVMSYQHGYSRNCGHHRNTAVNLMRQGMMVLCVNASMQGGNPALAGQLAELIASRNLLAPGYRPLPAPVVVGGHSAGGHFATEVGRRLVELGYPYLKGAMLFDPVAQSGFTNNLMAISQSGQRPVMAVTANSNLCNLYNNAYGALRQVQQLSVAAGNSNFMGVQLTASSTHVDAEGDNTDFGGYAACFNLAPKTANVTALRTLSSAWVNDMFRGGRNLAVYPDGATLNSLIGSGKAKLIP